MKVRQLLPTAEVVELDDRLAALAALDALPPFDDAATGFTAALSRALARDPRTAAHPAVQALSFWCRRSEVARLAERFAAMEGADAILVPRGTVFHIPPRNVDTLFVHSWLLALLAGNRNVIRLSDQADDVARDVVAVAADLLGGGAFDAVAARTLVVSYAHDDAVTAAASAACDVRVIWGGDATVHAVRAVPIAATAVDVAFPDRVSLAALDAAAVLALDDAGLAARTWDFANDAYWFDQRGCASPRVVVWRGSADAVVSASRRWFTGLAEAARRQGYRVDPSQAIAKLVAGCGTAIDVDVARWDQWGEEVTVLELATPSVQAASDVGGGFFLQARVEAIEELVPLLDRRVQTLTHLGFDRDELVGLARAANGRGIDRIVPVGRALSFSSRWDGVDLLRAFTREVTVEVAAG